MVCDRSSRAIWHGIFILLSRISFNITSLTENLNVALQLQLDMTSRMQSFFRPINYYEAAYVGPQINQLYRLRTSSLLEKLLMIVSQ